MTGNAIVEPRRAGRPCSVCSLTPALRTGLETQLAQGVSIARISRQRGAPSADAIARHIRAGHLPRQIEERVLRATGLDSVAVASRVLDIARRARASALIAAEQNNHAAVARAGDSELRALSALVAMGGASEMEIELDAASRRVFQAVVNVARTNPASARAVAAELERLGHVTEADDVLSHISRIEEIES